ncbi:DUF1128 domain-containing protein [Salibacterium salarium]|uniref:UPF0435 protein D7Z54_21465 n=1 Tax=Salibacterium salarium TaxID=284579 RepID=A0A3R9P277_9BACI|nr:DUF1128 domain-containing protein [Salibacterium salarium]RSL31261.1 DUF1128 domain-containing protein [Salibacterium salarium]
MSLEEKNQENLDFMVEEIAKKLQVVNSSAIQPENFDLAQYDDIKELYEMMETKDKVSVSEMDAIISELGSLKK